MKRPSNPRSHYRYTVAARRYLDERSAQPITCCLCGSPVDMQAPRTSSNGATVEHLTPVRELRRIASSPHHLLDLVCDQTRWAVAHRDCQSRQGGRAAASKTDRASRRW